MKEELKENLNEENEVIDCGLAEVIDTRTFTENGEEFTEEKLQLREARGTVSTITVRYKSGSRNLDVTYSSSGYGSNVYCSYQVASKRVLDPGRELVYGWNTARVKGDKERRYTNVSVAWPVPPSGNEAHEYQFFKYIRNSSTQSKPTRTYFWRRYLRGTGTTK
ncbi:hypothetical protein AVM15_14220 [Paraclostridium benzoelyticum]|nr:hypothetical protein AVM15_14220 [Paraclostridium benzoelyticum]